MVCVDLFMPEGSTYWTLAFRPKVYCEIGEAYPAWVRCLWHLVSTSAFSVQLLVFALLSEHTRKITVRSFLADRWDHAISSDQSNGSGSAGDNFLVKTCKR